MLSTKSWRVYRVLLSIALVLILIPTVGMCFYTRPSADDLAQPLPVALTWRETGSVIKTIGAAFEAAWDIYHNYSGIFFSMLLSVIPFSVFGTQWLWLNAVLAVVLLLWAMWRAANMIPLFCKDIRPEAVHCAALLLSLMTFLLMPSYHEGIYWFSGVANYIYVPVLGVGLFCSVIAALCTKKAPWWKVALWCVGFLCMGGGNWMTSTASIVVWGALAVYIVWKKKPKRLLLPFAFLLAGYLIAITAPGTSSRQATMNVDVSMVQAFLDSFAQSAHFLLRDARGYLFVLLMLPVAIEMVPHSRLQYKNALWLPALSVCVLAASMFPLLYQSSYWNDRHTNTCFLLLVFLLPVNLFWLMGWAVRKLQLSPREKPASGKALLACAMAVMLAIGALSVPGMTLSPLRFNCTLQPVTAMMHLIDGQARDYAHWYDSVADMVRTHAGEDVILREMRANELINPGYLIIDDPADWQNTSFAQYFGDENTTISYQP